MNSDDTVKTEVLQSLLNAGILPESAEKLVDNPFVDREIDQSTDEIARILILCEFPPPKEDETYQSILDSLKLEESALKKLKSIARDIYDHYGHREAAVIAIEYATGEYSKMECYESFPFNHTILDQEFTVEGKTFYNMTTIPESLYNHDYMTQDTNFYAYHATSWSAALNILKNGVDREFCRRKLDFGRRRSFYVGKSLFKAIEWSRKKRRLFREQNAIIQFRINQDIAEKYDKNVEWKILQDLQEWQAIVFNSRSDEPTSVDKIDFVEGWVLKYNKSIKSPKDCKNYNYVQIASKTDRSDSILTNHLTRVFFISQKIKQNNRLFKV